MHSACGHVVRHGSLGIGAVVVVGVACDVVLLAVLEHYLIQSRAYARCNHHTHGEHYAHPCREQLVRHALVGVYGDERVEQHHSRGTDYYGPLHAFEHSCCLHLEVHKQRCCTNEQESHGEEPLEVYTLVVEYEYGDQSDEVAQQYPVAQFCHLYLVGLHAHAYEYVHEHGAGVAYHQSDEEQNAPLNAARLESLEHEVGRAACLLQIEEQQR